MADAVENNANLPYMGAQVSWTGSLTENVQTLADHGIVFGKDWKERYRQARQWKTIQGNPRLDFVGMGKGT